MEKYTPNITRAQFIKMNKARRRVFLAKDVILQLELQHYRPGMGYMHVTDHGGECEVSAKDVINDNTCHVCAKGALVCSYVRHVNNIEYGKLVGNVSQNVEMKELWGGARWAAIEALYEGYHGFQSENTKHLGCTEGEYLFIRSIPNSVFRMRAIMELIIKCKGK
jgi:hypothetical protein